MNSNIPIKNIYYMLAYAYKAIHFSEYKNFDKEEFKNLLDLYSEILLLGLPTLIRGGLLKEYIRVEDTTGVIRGKIDINASIKKNALINKKLVVAFDEFSEDILLNQIIKASIIGLSRNAAVPIKKRTKLYSYLPYFSEVSSIELRQDVWREIQFNKQNLRFQFLVYICQLIFEELLINEGKLSAQASISDEQQLSSLFERFVYAFYETETNFNISHPQIPWKLDNGYRDGLPVMQTDMVIENEHKTLIIDTKFYGSNMSTRFETSLPKIISGNLYQIFTYLNNWVPKEMEEVSGMLLYAKTIATYQPDNHYQINGHKIHVVNIDLNQEFEKIKVDLLKLIDDAFI